MLRHLSFLFLFTHIFLSASISAFTLSTSSGASFNSDTVIVNVSKNLSFCNIAGVSANELLQMVDEAIHKFWNSVPTSRLKLQKGELINVNPAFETADLCSSLNGDVCNPNLNIRVSAGIVIACNDDSAANGNFDGPSTLAASLPNNVESNKIHGAVILINNETAGTNSFSSLSYDKKVSVIAHEIGHAIGLGHSQYSDSLMFFAIVPVREKLGQDDVDGVTYLYGRQDDPLALLGCATIDNNRDSGSSGGAMPMLSLLFGFLIPIVLRFRRKAIAKLALLVLLFPLTSQTEVPENYDNTKEEEEVVSSFGDDMLTEEVSNDQIGNTKEESDPVVIKDVQEEPSQTDNPLDVGGKSGAITQETIEQENNIELEKEVAGNESESESKSVGIKEEEPERLQNFRENRRRQKLMKGLPAPNQSDLIQGSAPIFKDQD